MATAETIAQWINGRVIGNNKKEVFDVSDLKNAHSSQVSFFSQLKYLSDFNNTNAGIILVTEDIQSLKTLIICKNPYLSLAIVANKLYKPLSYVAGIDPLAIVHPEAKIHPEATICAGAFVDKKAVIGKNVIIQSSAFVGSHAIIQEESILYPGAKVLQRCQIGKRCILHAGCVIGSDGFGFAKNENNLQIKIPQTGIVVIEDDVEVGANSTIDRATFGKTHIGSGTKIDNLVQIAHNVELGENIVIASQSGIAGSTKINDRVVLGAQSGVTGHITISQDTMFAGRSGVTKTIKKPGIYAGFPAVPHRKWLRISASKNDLPQIKKRLTQLEQAPKTNN